jgi:uncharacterized repeat protein (TIGR02543 family)
VGGDYGIGTVGGDIEIDGYAVVKAVGSTAAIETLSGGNVRKVNGVVYENGVGEVYGNVTLPGDLTVESGETLTVQNTATLTIDIGVTLTIDSNATAMNNGTIYNYGTIIGTVGGNAVQYYLTINDGGAGATVSGYYATAATVDIDAGTKSGHRFAGWTTADGVTFANPSSAATTLQMPANAVTVTATWTSAGGGSYDTYYTVTFNSNGGSTVAGKSVIDGGTVTKPADPTKPDYTFAGWFTDAELTKAYDFSAKVTKNFTLYAKWVAVDAEETPEVWVNPFIDVKAGDLFYGDVEYAVTSGLFNGTSATTFEPGAPMTRAMILTVLARHAGIDTSGGANWYEQAVAWGVASGITDGTRLDESVTRREIATLLYRYAGIGADGWGGEALVWVQAQKIMNDGRGDDTATRAEVAAVFHRFAEKVK